MTLPCGHPEACLDEPDLDDDESERVCRWCAAIWVLHARNAALRKALEGHAVIVNGGEYFDTSDQPITYLEVNGGTVNFGSSRQERCCTTA